MSGDNRVLAKAEAALERGASPHQVAHRFGPQAQSAGVLKDLAGLVFNYGGDSALVALYEPLTQTNGATAPDTERAAEPLHDPDAIRFDRYLATDPPERQMLIADVLPLDVVGLVASAGGVGKSVLTYQLGVSVATGARWLGLPIERVGGVLLIFTEDDDAELHRRGRRILDHYRDSGVVVDERALAERLYVVSRISEDTMLTRVGADGEVQRTQLVDRLIVLCDRIPNLRLVVLDTTSRLRGGQANVEEHATKYIEVLEAIREATRATVLATAHLNQHAVNQPDEIDQTGVRGSTALVDGARWVAVMRTLRRDQAEDWGVDPDDAKQYLRFDLAKANYVRPWLGLWLRREAGGVLVPTTLRREADARRQARQDERYAEVAARLVELLQREGPMTRRQVRKYAGTAGVLGAGDQTVRAVIERALRDRLIVERDEGLQGVLVPATEVES